MDTKTNMILGKKNPTHISLYFKKKTYSKYHTKRIIIPILECWQYKYFFVVHSYMYGYIHKLAMLGLTCNHFNFL